MGIIGALVFSFCSLFIAIDAVGILPSYSVYTQELKSKQKRHTLIMSLYVTAIAGGLVLIFGKLLSILLLIEVSDFQIAGGLLLFIMTVYYLIKGGDVTPIDVEKINIFPIASPMIIKPVLIVMILVSMASYGLMTTAVCFILNLLLLYAIFRNEKNIYGTLGDNGVGLVSKVLKIVLSVYALMLIRKGILALACAVFCCPVEL